MGVVVSASITHRRYMLSQCYRIRGEQIHEVKDAGENPAAPAIFLKNRYTLIMSEFEIEVLALVVLASCWLLWRTIGYSIREAIKERKNERK